MFVEKQMGLVAYYYYQMNVVSVVNRKNCYLNDKVIYFCLYNFGDE